MGPAGRPLEAGFDVSQNLFRVSQRNGFVSWNAALTLPRKFSEKEI